MDGGHPEIITWLLPEAEATGNGNKILIYITRNIESVINKISIILKISVVVITGLLLGLDCTVVSLVKVII